MIDAEDDLRVAGEAADGKLAVELAARLAPDVVLMDVRMPVPDGIEAARLITGAGTASAPLVLILTTSTWTSTSSKRCARGRAATR